MLCTPYGQRVVLSDLTIQYTSDSFVESRLRQLSDRVANESIWRFSLGYVFQKSENSDHGIIVECDLGVISFCIRVELRPASVVILGIDEVIYTFNGSLLILFGVSRIIESGQELDFSGCGTVVDGTVPYLFFLRSQFVDLCTVNRDCHVDVFRPSATFQLVNQNKYFFLNVNLPKINLNVVELDNKF